MKKTNLLGQPLPPVAEANVEAVLAREAFESGPGKDMGSFHRFRRDNRYFGLVPVRVSGNPGVEMMYQNDDRVAYRYFMHGTDAFEPFSVFLFSELARDCEAVLDVGAYTGLFGLLAARQNPRASVACFEPVPHIAERTRLNQRLNRLSNLAVCEAAVSRRKGRLTLTLYGATPATTGASLQVKKGPDMGAIEVEVTTIDDHRRDHLAGRRVGLIKLDTEGDEMNALAGAAGTLAEDQPILLAEVLSDEAMFAIADHAASLGYRSHYIDEPKWRLIPVASPTEGRIAERVVARHGYGNLLLSRPDRHDAMIDKALKARPQKG